MGNYCHYVSVLRAGRSPNSTSNTSRDGKVTNFDNSVRNTLNPKRDLKDNEMVGNALIVKEKNQSMVLGAEDIAVDTNGASEENRTGSPKVILLPHQHTLFCERKVFNI